MKIKLKKLWSLTIALILLLGIYLPLAAQAAGGTLPTEDIGGETWYVIEDAADLAAVMDPANAGTYWGTRLKISDIVYGIDATGITAEPIGSSTTPFTGSFNGNGKTITINGIDWLGKDFGGLFGLISGGSVQDVNLTITGSISGRSRVGGLAGSIENGTILTNCQVSGTVSASSSYCGGIVGYVNGGSIIGCGSSGTVTGKTYTGGIAGCQSSGSALSNCHSDSQVTGTSDYTGGIIGQSQGSIEGCDSSGDVSGYDCTGGIVGDNYGNMNNSFSTGSVTGSDYTGGVAGYNETGGILDCYSAGAVSGADHVGGVVGYNESSAEISGCYSQGTVSGDNYLAGVAGTNETMGTLNDCYAEGDIIATGQTVGGVAGDNLGTIQGCHMSGNVTGSDTNSYYVGGIAGYNAGSIQASFATGGVNGLQDIGGAVGWNKGIISHSYASGDVTGADNSIGGLIGFNGATGLVQDCYAEGTASGVNYVGGISGDNSGTIENCYATGIVTASSHSGGVSGYNGSGASTTFCYYLRDSGINETLGGIDGADIPDQAEGKTTAELKNQATFSGWDFASVWDIQAGLTYPYFRWDSPPSPPSSTLPIEDIGGVTWYLISNASDLQKVMDPANAGTYWGARLKIADGVSQIDATGITATPIATDANPFSGIFDGNQATVIINGINQPGEEEVGFFGMVQNGALIKDLSLVISGEIRGKSYVGGLVGLNKGDIQNCQVTGDVNGDEYVGGLVGDNDGNLLNCTYNGTVGAVTFGCAGGVAGINNSNGSIESCSARGSVVGGDNAGGIAGENDHRIINSSSESTVTGVSYCGGAVGINFGEVQNCCAKGNVLSSGESCGGFAGSNDEFIQNCYATGSATGIGNNTGAFAGSNHDRIFNCYATGNVYGEDNSGGFTGINQGQISRCFSTGAVQGAFYTGGFSGMSSGGSFVDCYATGSVSATGNFTGGFAGLHAGTAAHIIESCYSLGNVSTGGSFYGGFLGLNNGATVNTCYYLKDTGVNEGLGGINGADQAGQAEGETSSVMRQQAAYNGWNFSTVWHINAGESYPYLLWDTAVWSGNGDYRNPPLLLWEAVIIDSISLTPATLPSSGGNVVAFITGQNLDNPGTVLQVSIDGGPSTGTASVLSPNQAEISFHAPANTGSASISLTITALLNGSSSGKSAVLTIQGHSSSGGSSGGGGGGGGSLPPSTSQQPAVSNQPAAQTQTVIIFTIGSNLVLVNGRQETLDASPFINPNANRAMVPLRFLSERLGFKVDWLEASRQVKIITDDADILFSIGSNLVLVNGKPLEIDCPAMIIDNRTFVPLRHVAEILGAAVKWSPALQTVEIEK